MHFVYVRGLCCVLAVGLVLKLAVAVHAQTPTKDAAAVRKALDQKITLDFASQNFQEAIDHLRLKTKLNIVLDTFILQSMGVGIGEIPTPITLKSNDGKLRTALQNMLNQYHLTYVILGDSVLITTEDVGYLRQMRQRVNVDVKDVELTKALQQLSDETGTNLVVDPRQAEKAKAKISVQLDDVTLETAVRLLTELADLSSVRVGNVLFVTSEARADKLRRENTSTHPIGPDGVQTMPFPGGFPGFRGGFALPPIGGRLGGGFGGFGGIAVPDVAPAAPPKLIPPQGGAIDPPPPVAPAIEKKRQK